MNKNGIFEMTDGYEEIQCDYSYKEKYMLNKLYNLRANVYIFLFIQLIITTIFGATAMMCSNFQNFLIRNTWINSVSGISALVMIIFASCCKRQCLGTYPMNVIFMLVFTIFVSLTISVICAAYASVGLGYLVLQAFCITAISTFVLAMYAIYSGVEFSCVTAILFNLLIGLVIIIPMQYIIPFGSKTNGVIDFLGIMVFGMYILYDFDSISNRTDYKPEDWAIVTLELYLDIVNLFLQILKFLSDND